MNVKLLEICQRLPSADTSEFRSFTSKWINFVKSNSNGNDIPEKDWNQLFSRTNPVAGIDRGEMQDRIKQKNGYRETNERRSFVSNWDSTLLPIIKDIINPDSENRIKKIKHVRDTMRDVIILGGGRNTKAAINRILITFCPDILIRIPNEDKTKEFIELLKPFSDSEEPLIIGEDWIDNSSHIMEFLKKQLGETIYKRTLWDVYINLKNSDNSYNMNTVKGNTNMLDKYISLLETNKNLILTGAPGTGKTYLAKEIAKQMLSVESDRELKMDKRYGFVQFHPSYDYTDFVEGLRPKTENNTVSFECKDGVFKEFCKQALLSESVDADILSELNANPTVWKVSLEGTGDNPTRTDCMENGYIRIGWSGYGDVEDFNDYENYSEGGKNILRTFQHVMQIGDIVVSCYSAKEIDAVGIVTGDYEYKPEGGSYPRYRTVKWLVKEIKENIVEQNGGKAFTLPTVYKATITPEAALKIVQEHTKKIGLTPRVSASVFIIDEINRGEISKIFGELFFSIDPGYRGERGRVKTQYKNMIEDGDVFKDGFYVPENVYIIGTMNDIDRSVESMDFAMRRRFAWQEVTAEESYANMIENDLKFSDTAKAAIKQRMFALNEAIAKTEGLDKSYQIGAAYFRKYLDYKDQPKPFDSLWENHLEGLLSEYLRGNRKAAELLKNLRKAYNLTSTDEQPANNYEG